MNSIAPDRLLRQLAPRAPAVPVVFDSPHSGTDYPADFGTIAPLALIRRSEDAFIDEIFGSAPDHGAPLIAAEFPRIYIDPNRDLIDLDPSMMDGAWPDPLVPSRKTELGVGLIWRIMPPDTPLYDRLLSVEEVRGRIDRCWRPYHQAVASAIEETHRRFGKVWHVNCHSMPAVGNAASEDGPVARAEFVLGDRDGTTCEPGFTAFVAGQLRDMGYQVKINEPYKGVELVRRYSDPAKGRHSLQLEINRKLYMDEERIEKNGGFSELQANIDKLIAAICTYAQQHVA
ncbi:N-formylglutamate amidohydrolase [Pelagibius marinus]|uniref:N-formylglutamate amidohydrolase n=1 Tax=Pelagibius marinus TaxID=2762760 RepID=UPI001872F9E3|nr:N-formylglutamate amidohydrolase [Pelagibius marinus]